MSENKPLSPSKAAMIKRANKFLVVLGEVPAIFLAVAVLLELAGGTFATNQSFVLQVFSVLVLLSLITLGMTVFVMTSKRLMSETNRYGPIGQGFQIMSIGAVLSLSQAVYGLILTLLSGSIFYLVGFSLVTWASLWWVRRRFKQSLEKLPDNKP